MLFFRGLLLLLMLASVVSFVVYAGTGQVRFRRYGLIILTWTLVAAFAFFAVLIVERIA